MLPELPRRISDFQEVLTNGNHLGNHVTLHINVFNHMAKGFVFVPPPLVLDCWPWPIKLNLVLNEIAL